MLVTNQQVSSTQPWVSRAASAIWRKECRSSACRRTSSNSTALRANNRTWSSAISSRTHSIRTNSQRAKWRSCCDPQSWRMTQVHVWQFSKRLTRRNDVILRCVLSSTAITSSRGINSFNATRRTSVLSARPAYRRTTKLLAFPAVLTWRQVLKSWICWMLGLSAPTCASCHNPKLVSRTWRKVWSDQSRRNHLLSSMSLKGWSLWNSLRLWSFTLAARLKTSFRWLRLLLRQAVSTILLRGLSVVVPLRSCTLKRARDLKLLRIRVVWLAPLETLSPPPIIRRCSAALSQWFRGPSHRR